MKRINKLFFLAISLILLLTSATNSNAQNSEEAKKHYDKAIKLINKKQIDGVPKLLADALTAELALEDGMDHSFVADLYVTITYFYKNFSQFHGYTATSYYRAGLHYTMAGKYDKAKSAHQLASAYMDSCILEKSQYTYKGLPPNHEYTRYPIDSILGTSGDTTFFSLPLGTRDSITGKTPSYLVTIYDKDIPERNVISYGESKLVKLEYGSSVWYVTPSDEGRKSGFTPQKGDLLYTKVAVSDNRYKGLIYDLVQYDIRLTSSNRYDYYDYHLSQRISSAKEEDAIITLMRRDIQNTAVRLYDTVNGFMLDDLDSGAFAGMNMWEAMLQTTNDDVRAFLRFVAAFPGKYMGRDYKVDETYATWLINQTPLAENDGDLILEKYKAVENDSAFDVWLNQYGRYLQIAEFDFATINNKLNNLVVEKSYQRADSITKQWIDIAETYATPRTKIDFMYVLAWSKAERKQYDQALEIYNQILEMDSNDLNSYYQMGNIHLDQEEYKACLKEFQYLIDERPDLPHGYGSYGWALLKMGKNKPAQVYLEKAYLLDSTQASYAMNYGHSFLLMNDTKTARKYYLKALEIAQYTSTITEGLFDDFDYFINDGRMVNVVKNERAFIESEWEKHYKFKIGGTEYFEKGKSLEKEGENLEAALAFDTAISLELQGRYVHYRLLRNYNRWAAFNYHKVKLYDSSLARYRTAWNINREHMNDAELEVDDLEAISNLNSWLNNDVMEQMYEKMANAAKRKLQSQNRSNNLYLVSVGSNGDGAEGYQTAASDAKKIADVILNKTQRLYDNTYTSVLTNSSLDTIRRTIEHIISESQTGDCFIFYYTGYTSNDDIIYKNDTITNDQLLAWMSSMSANKKLILMDAQNASLVSNYIETQRDAKSDFNKENISFLISDGRIEMPNSKGGLFTSYLMDGINGEAATNWKNKFLESKAEESSIAYVTSKSLEGYMYGNMQTGNLDFDLKSYSTGIDFPLTFVTSLSMTVDTIPPMIYMPNVTTIDGKRGGKTKVLVVNKMVSGQALDESGIAEITINDKPIKFSQNGKFTISQNFTDAYNTLVIRVVDKKGNVALDSFPISKTDNTYVDPSTINESQKNYALLFATSHYDEWSDLANPLKDVTRIKTLLETYYGFEVQVVVDATIEQMDSIIYIYKKKKEYAPKDQLLVYFAGHGHYEPGYGGYIVAKNSKKEGNMMKNLRTNYLKFDDIRSHFNLIYDCKHILLVFDVCFGGTAFDKNSPPSTSTSDIDQMFKSPEKYLEKKLAIQSRLFMTSGGKEYVPDISQFAVRFIETLESKGSKKNGFVTFDDFTNNLQTISLLPEDQHPTTPRYGKFDDNHPGGDFILRYIPPTKPKTHVMTNRLEVK